MRSNLRAEARRSARKLLSLLRRKSSGLHRFLRRCTVNQAQMDRIVAALGVALAPVGERSPVPVLRAVARGAQSLGRYPAGDGDFRAAAIMALRYVRARKAVLSLADLLAAEGHSKVGQQLVRALGKLGLREAAPALLERLRAGDRGDALAVLRRWKAPGLIPALLATIDRGYEEQHALAKLGVEECLDALERMFLEEGPERSRAARAVMEKARRPRSLAFFLRVAADESAPVALRDSALCGAYEFPPKRWVDAAVPLLAHPEEELSERAAWMLNSHKPARAEPGLRALLAHERPSVRDRAAMCLAVLGQRDVADRVFELFVAEGDPDAEAGLYQLGDLALAHRLADRAPTAHPYARGLLGRMLLQFGPGDERVERAVLSLLGPEAPEDVRRTTAWALGQRWEHHRDTPLGPALRAGLTELRRDARKEVREAAERVLAIVNWETRARKKKAR